MEIVKKDLKIREIIEEREYSFLNSDMACFARESTGRLVKEEESSVRTCFQKDRDRIIHSESFRRLKDKTQVFIFGGFTHPRTRLTHTLEVSQIARTIARATSLNEDLVEAISLGHDLGHAPFGHLGERVINSRTSFRFHHSLQSLRIVDTLEKNGKGLNLTNEVRDGIIKHSKSSGSIESSVFGKDPQTSEAYVVRIADSIAYLNHDIDDSLKMGIINIEEFPGKSLEVLGKRHAERISTMVNSVINYCIENKKVGMHEEILQQTNILRDFMFKNIYLKADLSEGSKKAVEMLEYIWDFYKERPSQFKADFTIRKEYDSLERMMADNISSLTDNEVGHIYERIIL